MAEWISSLQRLFAVDFSAALGVRQLIIVAVVMVVIYMLVMVFRIKSLNARRRFEEGAAARYEADLTDHPSKKPMRREPPPDPLMAESRQSPRVATRLDPAAFYEAMPRVEPPKNKYFEPPERPVPSFDQEKMNRLERDLAATREELDSLRTAFSQSRDSMQAEIERLKAGQRVAPSHGDALQMAMAGASAEAIAARCGIARAEAELVLSLAKGAGEAPLGGTDEVGQGRGNDGNRGGRPRYGSY